jgi:hypothetical protein
MQQPVSGLFELRSLSGLMQQPQEFWASTKHTSRHKLHTPSAAGDRVAASHVHAASTAPAAAAAPAGIADLPELAPPAAAAGSLAGTAFDQQQQQQQQQRAAQLSADLDMLSRLSPLESLSCFQLHLQHNMPQGGMDT